MNSYKISAEEGKPLYFKETISIQYAVDPKDQHFCFPKYKVNSVLIDFTEKGCDRKILGVSQNSGSELPPFSISFTMIRDSVIRIQIEHESGLNFRTPDYVFNPDMPPSECTGVKTNITDVLKTAGRDEEFYFEVHEYKNESNVLYSIKDLEFVHTPNYMKTTAYINSDKIYGLGERVGEFFLKDGVYTIWARDELSPVETGKRPSNSVYGAHPVYFSKLKNSTKFFAVFDNNVGAQDFIIESNDTGKIVTHIKSSGITDMFIILNDDIQKVNTEYIKLVGLPAMFPQWVLGWNHCRYGYNNTEQFKEVVDKFAENHLPLDAMWADVEYLDMYKDFSISDTDFKGFADAVKDWREKKNIKFIPIFDGAIAKDGANSPYSRGVDKGVFIKDPVYTSKPFIGRVWPGKGVYVDWLHDEAINYWGEETKRFNKMIGFDGMWLDMNEPSSMCHGICNTTEKKEFKNPIQNSLFYVPGSRDLSIKTVSVDAVHVNGVTEFEMHSLYGFYMSIASYKYLEQRDKDKRPYVMTRSSYAGVGKYASHWLGDNFSTYEMLKYSVGGIYNFNFFGVPVTGADI